MAARLGRTRPELRRTMARVEFLKWYAYKAYRIKALQDTDDQGKTVYGEHIRW